jgi:tRNA (guanine26-N2/guanine27-N2)-dimethyltransferase
VRLAIEVRARVIMGDLNPSGIALTEENVRRNGVTDRVSVREMDANLLMNLHSGPMNRLDYMDVDPYGSPAQFLDSAVRATRDGGAVALTATDMAPLCGVSPTACLRKYGGRPLRAAYTHEVALRLLLGAAVRAAAVHELGATPLCSFYVDHYVRAYIRVTQGAKPADASLAEMGYIVHCPRCLHREAVKGAYLRVGRICPVCGGQFTVGGPMWLGEIASTGFTSKMMEQMLGGTWDPRLGKLLETVERESGLPPTFFNLDELSSRTGSSSLNTERALSTLHEAGFKATRTHFDPRGIRTTATAAELANVIKS